jgi:hypothetical protein
MAKIREIVTELAGYYAEPSRINKMEDYTPWK